MRLLPSYPAIKKERGTFDRALNLARYLQKRYPVKVDGRTSYFEHEFRRLEKALGYGAILHAVRKNGSGELPRNVIFNQYQYLAVSDFLINALASDAKNRFGMRKNFSHTVAVMKEPLRRSALNFTKIDNGIWPNICQKAAIDEAVIEGFFDFGLADHIRVYALIAYDNVNNARAELLGRLRNGTGRESAITLNEWQCTHIIEHAALMTSGLGRYATGKVPLVNSPHFLQQ